MRVKKTFRHGLMRYNKRFLLIDRRLDRAVCSGPDAGLRFVRIVLLFDVLCDKIEMYRV
ncbi:MAG: hypothetical protein K0S22_350 [Oscillospiraceae bacterium]|nr:hypothetical protein [Oscillospiraceae bacterium]